MAVALVLLAWILVGLIRTQLNAPLNHIAILLVFLGCGLVLMRRQARFQIHTKGRVGLVLCVGYIAVLLTGHIAFGRWSEFLHSAAVLASRDSIRSLVMIAFVVPIYEEVFFRGAILTRMKPNFGNSGMLVYCNALLFWIFHAPLSLTAWSTALQHFALPLGPGPFLLGLVCATITVKDNSIFWAIVFHALANGLGSFWANLITNESIFRLFYSQ